MSKARVKALVVAFAAAMFAASIAPAVPVASASSTVQVDIVHNAQQKDGSAYDPNPVRIEKGDAVRWMNKDTTIHTATAGTPSGGPTGMFGGTYGNPKLIAPLTTQQFTFTREGQFSYYCILHPTMIGLVIVGNRTGALSVHTDSADYRLGDQVTVTGRVTNPEEGLPVNITVSAEDGLRARADQIAVDPAGDYQYQFKLVDQIFRPDAAYTVTAEYGDLEAQARFSIGAAEATCQSLPATISGTEGDDIINGTKGNDVIAGLGGNDIIRGLGGDDTICGGPGNDRLSGGWDNDRVLGGRGSDFVFGNSGDDRLWGGTGFDRLFGGDGNDSLSGGKGNDRLKGGNGSDQLDGQQGSDILDGVPEQAGSSGITAEIEGSTTVGPGDSVTISGSVNGADDTDQIEWSVDAPGSGSESDTEDLSSGGDFDFVYDVPSNADDGIYAVEIDSGNEDPVFLYFVVDAQADNIEVATDEDAYLPGDDVLIQGEVDDSILELGLDTVEITILGPNGDDAVTDDLADLDGNDFSYNDFSIDNGDYADGMYAVIVSYDGIAEGFTVFQVQDENSVQMTASLSKTSYKPGDTVTINGSIDENDVDPNESVYVTVEDPSNLKIVNGKGADPDINGDFEYTFDLADDAETGTYHVILQYSGYDDKSLTFAVTSSGGGSEGGPSGEDHGLTARLDDDSLLAGGTLTVSGLVPRIVTDEDSVSITIKAPDGTFVAAKFPEPDADKSYSATFSLPSSLEKARDYTLVVYYDNKEVDLSFDIVGVSSSGPSITVTTDNTTYSTGSVVMIGGNLDEELLVPGEAILLQVYNSEGAPYRFDPIIPDSDGSYHYKMVVGGPLGVSGEWLVRVMFLGNIAETHFELAADGSVGDA